MVACRSYCAAHLSAASGRVADVADDGWRRSGVELALSRASTVCVKVRRSEGARSCLDHRSEFGIRQGRDEP